MRLREVKYIPKVTQLMVEPAGEPSNSKACALDHSAALPYTQTPSTCCKTLPLREDRGGQGVPSPAPVTGLLVDQRARSQALYVVSTTPKETHTVWSSREVERYKENEQEFQKGRSPVECPLSG